ncbi:DUF11 domain-containing protein [Patescibacteria group bacterium]|nr:DUF11 domain-containing protein [Patescibacteria group bacterium]
MFGNKMFKKLLIIILAVWLYLPLPALAADLVVTCEEEGPCATVPANTPLFNVSDVKPGISIYKSFRAINNDPDDDCSLVMSTKHEDDPNGFAEVLFTVINDGSSDLFGNTVGGQAGSSNNLRDLFALAGLDLGTVPAAGGIRNYFWTVTIDPAVGNSYQGVTAMFDFDLHFACGSPEENEPELVITKTNDKKDQVLGVGAVVYYEITVTNTGTATANNVSVKDVQPVGDYFDYRENSGHLTCTDNPDTDLSATGTNPYYWDFEDMTAGEVCTLTYEMEILNDSIPGTHYNLAVAKGYGGDDDGRVYFSNVVEDPFDVGQAGEPDANYQGEVLGASIGQVLGAATGNPTFWLILALSLTALGSILKLHRRRAGKIIKLLILILLNLAFMLNSQQVILAADNDPPVIAIVQLPEYLNKRDFEISYTALDGGEAGLKDVHIEYKKEGESWQDLGTYSEESRKVAVNSGQINEDKKYYFKATACDNNSNCDGNETSTTIDTTSPPPPEQYNRYREGEQAYRITWYNPDSDDLDQVYIYRGDSHEYDLNPSSRVAAINVTKNSQSEWLNDPVPDKTKEYFYALRSVDKAGNASDPIGDTWTTTTTVEGETVTGSETIAGQELISQKTAPGESKGQILGEEEAQETTEEAFGADEETGKEEADNQPLPRWLLFGGAGLLVLIVYVRQLAKKKK